MHSSGASRREIADARLRCLKFESEICAKRMLSAQIYVENLWKQPPNPLAAKSG